MSLHFDKIALLSLLLSPKSFKDKKICMFFLALNLLNFIKKKITKKKTHTKKQQKKNNFKLLQDSGYKILSKFLFDLLET